MDSSLYDNAANTYNEAAPGADRLRIRPTLFVVNTDIGSSNSQFLPLVEFNDGVATKENRNTIYNELAKNLKVELLSLLVTLLLIHSKAVQKKKHLTALIFL